MRNLTKRQCEAIHSKRRALERYNLSLNRHDLRDIVSMITNNQATFLLKESNTRSHWLVVYKEKKLKLVYDKPRKMIITFLPLEEENVSIKKM